jgi:preprotein translocase subunit SecG
LIVSAPAVVTVGPQSSTTVPISVTASDKADLGSYTFSVLVDGKQTVFGAEIVEGSSVSNPVVVLTVILAIIFVVLLVVLIVLLVRRDKPAEEAETSYY